MAVGKFLGMEEEKEEVEEEHDFYKKEERKDISWDWNKWVKLEGLEMQSRFRIAFKRNW